MPINAPEYSGVNSGFFMLANSNRSCSDGQTNSSPEQMGLRVSATCDIKLTDMTKTQASAIFVIGLLACGALLFSGVVWANGGAF